MKSKALQIGLIFLLGAMFATLYMLMQRPWTGGASVVPGGEYTIATSTGTQAGFPNYRNALQTDYRPGYGTTTPGTLGTVLITRAALGRFCLHDATSTATNAENTSGTTTIACFGPNAAGPFPFDYTVQRGVLVEQLDAATVGWASTTITGRR